MSISNTNISKSSPLEAESMDVLKGIFKKLKIGLQPDEFEIG